ncbi:BQ2448_2035 [Microbotryum intermedium]|uniref:BQ2448_2035 protein n=1 Tax=Microbotryum intermedium TaxID=269621 RepID=A0A238F745_9BASI|nr:BQ2448_2035 [Microbotryum intermedium]
MGPQHVPHGLARSLSHLNHGTIPDTWTKAVRAQWEHYAGQVLFTSLTAQATRVIVPIYQQYAPNDAHASAALIGEVWGMPRIPTDRAGLLGWSKRAKTLATNIRMSDIDIERILAARILVGVPPALQSWRLAFMRGLQPGQKKLPSLGQHRSEPSPEHPVTLTQSLQC